MNKLQKNYKQAMLHKIACLLLLILGVINTVKGQENTFTDEQFVYKLGLTKLFLPNILVLGLKHPQGCQCHRKFSF